MYHFGSIEIGETREIVSVVRQVKIKNAEKAKKKETRKTAYRHRSSNNYLSSVGQKEGLNLILKES